MRFVSVGKKMNRKNTKSGWCINFLKCSRTFETPCRCGINLCSHNFCLATVYQVKMGEEFSSRSLVGPHCLLAIHRKSLFARLDFDEIGLLMQYLLTCSAFSSTREMAYDSTLITSLAVCGAVLLARLLMATSAPITRCRWPVHSFLSSFRFCLFNSPVLDCL